MKITPGSRIVGKSGKYLTVDRIEGDILYCGELTVRAFAVVRVIPPAIAYPSVVLKVGDKVEYIGSNFSLKTQYAGVLEVRTISPRNGYSCLKPGGAGVTSWIDREDLQLVEVV